MVRHRFCDDGAMDAGRAGETAGVQPGAGGAPVVSDHGAGGPATATDQPRVVVVDDEDEVRRQLGSQLRAAGMDVVGEVADSESALEACAELQPDVVVFDLVLPDLSGFAVIPALLEAQPDTDIVAQTSVPGDFVQAEMSRLGVTLVSKSSDPEPLVEAIEDCLNRRP